MKRKRNGEKPVFCESKNVPKIKTVKLDLLNKKDLNKFLKSKEFKGSKIAEELIIEYISSVKESSPAKKMLLMNKEIFNKYIKNNSITTKEDIEALFAICEETKEEEIEATGAEEGPYKEEIVKSYKRRKCGRKKLSEDLPRREIYLDIPEEEKQCACGTTLVKVGEDRSERLQVIPAQIYVEVTVRPKYACRNCEGSGDEDKPVFRQMPAPKNIISKSISTPNLLAFIFSQKFFEHNPYYRQSKAFERRLIDISRADMDNWQLKVYEKLKPMEKILMNHIKSGPVINYG